MKGAWAQEAQNLAEGLRPPGELAPTDPELMARLAGGDRDALAPLMARHHARIYRIALSYLRNPDDALDVVQETFVRAFQHAGRWESDAAVSPWLTRIAVNQAIDRYRRIRRRRQTEEPMPEGDHASLLHDPTPSAERAAIGGQLGQRIGAALQLLPDRQRAVFVLRHYEELSLEEIGTSLGMNLGTVKSSLHRAIQRLRVSLAQVRA